MAFYYPFVASKGPKGVIEKIFTIVTCWLVIALYPVGDVLGDPPAGPLVNAHAHNDYEHARPLLDALDHGFTSIEADVFLVDGELLVAHQLKDVQSERTLESLYLKPLYERVKTYGGSVFQSGEGVTLLVDIKRDGAAVYAELEKLLQKYAEIISVTVDGIHHQKAVTVIVSGDRPIAEIIASNPCYVGIDGRLSDLDSDWPASLMPLISDNWRIHFRYRAREEDFTEAERMKLQDIVQKTHQRGRRLRFWATPESEQMWNILQEAGVDLIGTDELSRLSQFLFDAEVVGGK
jgi:glycerophosphoryl diester phosphodiesterase